MALADGLVGIGRREFANADSCGFHELAINVFIATDNTADNTACQTVYNKCTLQFAIPC